MLKKMTTISTANELSRLQYARKIYFIVHKRHDDELASPLKMRLIKRNAIMINSRRLGYCIFIHLIFVHILQVMAIFVSVARLVLSPTVVDEPTDLIMGFRLRASTDGSIERRRKPDVQQQHVSKRRLSISARGAPH